MDWEKWVICLATSKPGLLSWKIDRSHLLFFKIKEEGLHAKGYICFSGPCVKICKDIYISSKRKITFVSLHDNWDLHWALMPVPHPLKVLLKQPTNNARQHVNGKFPVWVHHKYYNLINYYRFLCTWDNQLQTPPFRARLVRRDDEWNKKKEKSQLFEWTNVFYGAKQSFYSVFPTIIVNVKNLKNPPCSWISSFL